MDSPKKDCFRPESSNILFFCLLTTSNIIEEYIQKHQLFTPGDRIIVGLSGGADSVALLYYIRQSGYDCIAAHCNFHLRGEESMRDETFSGNFASSLQIPFEKIDFDTLAFAAKHKISVEMAARELRYAWFEELRIKYHANVIAIAHHRNDDVETVLLNMIRGTGIRGLTGIRPKTGFIVRPLLCLNKEEILEYIQKKQLQYITDSTNLQDEFTRNRIRNRIIPLLQEINPSVLDAISRTSRHLSQVEKIYFPAIQKGIDSVCSCGSTGQTLIDIEKLLTYPSPEALLYEILSEYNFNNSIINEIGNSLHAQSGKQFFSPTHRLVKDRKYMELSLRTDSEEEPMEYTLSEHTEAWDIPVHLECRSLPYTSGFVFETNKNIAYFDKDLLQFPLKLRKWEEGDFFIPFGMKGQQKISKYFKDHRFSLPEKERTWLLCSGNDIIWVVGQRSDNRYRVTSGTRNIYQIRFGDIV